MMGMQAAGRGNVAGRIWRAGSGPKLFFLHGFEQHPGSAPFMERLATTREVFAPEHPGYGETEGLERLHDIVDLVLHYRRMLETWTTEPVDVMGHSIGGMFAAEIAALCPHRVRRLVLVDPYGLWLDRMPLPDPFVLTPERLRAAKWADPSRAPNPEPAAGVSNGAAASADLFRARNLGAATKFMWPIPDRGLSRRLPFIAAPTLIVQGAQDGLVPPAYADAFAEMIPQARVALIQGAGHLPMIEKEDGFMEAVDSFLNG